jgi:hypothetical protein
MMRSLRALPYALPFLLLAGLAQAATRQMHAVGSSLAIDSPCAKSVTVEPDASLSGQVVAVATAEHQEEVDQLRWEGGSVAKLRGPMEQCWRLDDSSSWEPTMTIAVRVPPGFAIAVDEAGGAQYEIGDIGGQLTLDISGGVVLKAARAKEVSIDLSGGGEITLGSVTGDMKAEISGGGTVTAQHGALQTLSLDMSGGGGFTLAGGSVAKLTVDMSGGGAARLDAPVGDAALDVSGGGTVRIAKVTGSLTKDVSGSGSVDIGD